MDQVVQLATNILRDLKGISSIQQAFMFLGGGSGAVVGGALGYTSSEATAVGVAAAGASASSISSSTVVAFAGIGALTGLLIGLGIGTAVQAYLNEKERKKLKKKMEMQFEQRLKRVMKNAKDLRAIIEEDDFAAGKKIGRLILIHEKGVISDDVFLQKIEKICLDYCQLDIEQVKALEPLPV